MHLTEALRIFVRVADLASFSAAADELGLPRATVSAAVQAAEAELGTRLLHRTTRRVELTQDGLAVRERALDLLADVEEIRGLFRAESGQLRGRIRVDMPEAVACDLVMPALPKFLAQHPELEVQLSSTDRRVDLVREGFDCVMRVGQLTDSSLVVRGLGHYRMINVASPAYLRAMGGKPRTLADLASHRLVHYTPSLGGNPDAFEYVDEADGSIHHIAMTGALTVNTTAAYQAAALAGLGIIQVPASGVADLIQSRRLVEVLPKWRAAPMPVSLLYPHRRQLPRRVQVFMGWLGELMKRRLEPTH